MASTNFLVFDEGKQNMMSDGDYSANTQRARGVTPGIAYPNLHNKLYYQVSVMAKAIADFMVAQGANASDEDVEQLTDDISNAFTNFVDNQTKDVYLPLSGGTMKGNINANGYNITATKFIGNLQGKADSATNADLATKATQDSQGQAINTTYVKGITASNATLTVTKGNGTTSTVTINNVGNSTKATQDSQGQQITTTYLKKFGGQITDFNITTEGIYYWGSADALTNNAPEMQSKPGVVCVFADEASPSRIFQVANIVSNGASYIRSYVNGNWGSWNKIAYIDSPAFSGTPIAPTPSTSDNSTKIATTAFVKSLFTASKQQNGWHKEASTGMIWQWGEWNIQSISASASTNVTFPISFPNKCLFVIPSVYNAAEDQIGYLNVTQTGCSFKKGVNDDTIGRNGLYLVIGY